MKYLKVSAVFLAVLVAGTGSSVLLDGFAEVEGFADIKKPVLISEVYYDSSVSRDSAGEYVLLRVNADVLDLSEWNLTSLTDGGGENAINYSRKVTEDWIALVDNSSTVSDPGSNWLVLDVGTFPDSGLDNSGEFLELGFLPGNIRVSSANYTGSSCSESQAYNVSRALCDQRQLAVGGGG
ncbi:MAG: hypothetical protein ABEK10_01280 [Candidatus Nanosalina sp.]